MDRKKFEIFRSVFRKKLAKSSNKKKEIKNRGIESKKKKNLSSIFNSITRPLLNMMSKYSVEQEDIVGLDDKRFLLIVKIRAKIEEEIDASLASDFFQKISLSAKSVVPEMELTMIEGNDFIIGFFNLLLFTFFRICRFFRKTLFFTFFHINIFYILNH